MHPDAVLVERDGRQVPYTFSHVVSTPLGEFAVFVDPDSVVPGESAQVTVYKLVEPTEAEAEMVAELWARMGEEVGDEGDG